MNSKDFRNLQEAYLNVYEQEESLDEVLDTPKRVQKYTQDSLKSVIAAKIKNNQQDIQKELSLFINLKIV